jgi:hypothetical protein
MLKTFLESLFELFFWKLRLVCCFGCLGCHLSLRRDYFQASNLFWCFVVVESRCFSIGWVGVSRLIALETCQWYRSFLPIPVRLSNANVLLIKLLVKTRHFMLRLKMHWITRFNLRIFEFTFTRLDKAIFSASPSPLGHNNWYQTLASKWHQWLANALLAGGRNFDIYQLQRFVDSLWQTFNDGLALRSCCSLIP